MRIPTTITLITAGLLLAACGSSTSSSTTGAASGAGVGAGSGNYQKGLQLASCMRSHGVPNFPDPKTTGNGAMLIQSSNGQMAVNGVTVNAPAFQSAMQACHTDLPGGGRPAPLSASRRDSALKFSQCMRAHGLTGFPDPSFARGGVQIRIPDKNGLSPNSPAFKAAQQACGSLLGKAGPAQGAPPPP